MKIIRSVPDEARDKFIAKRRNNFAISVIVFIVLLSFVFTSINMWLVVVLALTLASGLFFYLENFAIYIQCPNLDCKGKIATNAPWECGYCHSRNENAKKFPLMFECEHCHQIPKTYICHHCGQPIYLTPDHQALSAAKCLSTKPVKPKTVVVKDPAGEKIASQQEQIRDKKHEYEMAKWQKQIDTEKNGPTSQMSDAEKLEADITAAVNKGMSIYEIQKRLKEKADVECANDEHTRNQKHALIDEQIRIWLDELGEPKKP